MFSLPRLCFRARLVNARQTFERPVRHVDRATGNGVRNDGPNTRTAMPAGKRQRAPSPPPPLKPSRTRRSRTRRSLGAHAFYVLRRRHYRLRYGWRPAALTPLHDHRADRYVGRIGRLAGRRFAQRAAGKRPRRDGPAVSPRVRVGDDKWALRTVLGEQLSLRRPFGPCRLHPHRYEHPIRIVN